MADYLWRRSDIHGAPPDDFSVVVVWNPVHPKRFEYPLEFLSPAEVSELIASGMRVWWFHTDNDWGTPVVRPPSVPTALAAAWMRAGD